MSIQPPLRDIHLPPEPGAWPPSVLALAALAMVLALLGLATTVLWRRLARRRRLRTLARFFDAQLEEARSEEERLQRASICLRRAVAHWRPGMVATTGTAWLEFLDAGDPARPFSQGPGQLLAEGPFRARLEPGATQAAIELARGRVLEWGAGDGA